MPFFKSMCLKTSWLIIRANKFFATGKKSSNNYVDQVILTNLT